MTIFFKTLQLVVDMNSTPSCEEIDFVEPPGNQEVLGRLFRIIGENEEFKRLAEVYFDSLSYEDRSAFVEDHEADLAPMAAACFHVITYAEDSACLRFEERMSFETVQESNKKAKLNGPAEEIPPPPAPGGLTRSVSMKLD